MRALDPVVDYRLAEASDRGAVVALLQAENLVTIDLTPSGVLLLLAHADGHLAGVVGIQPRGRVGLIRSLAVERDFRGLGIGHALVARAEALAADSGLHTLFLLTDGATTFWTKYGYVAVPRVDVPPEIQDTAQFTSLCPASAVCMRHVLSDPERSGVAQKHL